MLTNGSIRDFGVTESDVKKLLEKRPARTKLQVLVFQANENKATCAGEDSKTETMGRSVFEKIE